MSQKAVGRPVHNFWAKGHFEKSTKNGRLIAVCMVCSRELKNTSRQRLVIHRRKCTSNGTDDNDETTINELISNSRKLSNSTSSGKPNIIDESDTDGEYESIQVYIENDSEESIKLGEASNSDHQLIKTSQEVAAQQKQLEETPNKKLNTSGSSVQIREIVDTSSSTTMIETDDIHSTFAEFFYESNLPLTVLHSTYFQRFLRKLNSNYRLPSIGQLNGNYLKQTLEKHKQPKSDEIQDATLILNGWRNSKQNGCLIIACLHLHSDDKTRRVFLNVWDLDTVSRRQAEEEILKEATKMAKEMYNANICSIISDNLKFCLNQNEHTPPWHSICHTYMAGLLASDIIKANNVCSTIVQTLKELENLDCQTDITAIGGVRITLPWKNRWCTYLAAFQCYQKNNSILRELILNGKCQVSPEMNAKIGDNQFLRKVENCIEALEPICRLIYLSQKKETTLAELIEEWLQMNLPSEFEKYLKKRRNMILHPFAMTANCLHPEFHGRSLSEEQTEMVETFLLENLSSNGLEDFLMYRSNEGVFKVLNSKGLMNYRTFWNFARRKHPSLAGFAEKLLGISVSVSYVDKFFSNHSIIHSPTRNTLGMDTYKKLLNVHLTLKFAASDES